MLSVPIRYSAYGSLCQRIMAGIAGGRSQGEDWEAMDSGYKEGLFLMIISLCSQEGVTLELPRTGGG